MLGLIASTETLDSRLVAEMVEKTHSHLLRDINGYIAHLVKSITDPKDGLSEYFVSSSYQDSTGRTLPCYLITRKGCEFIANKLTGEKGSLFTKAYIDRFHEMEKGLMVTKNTGVKSREEVILQGYGLLMELVEEQRQAIAALQPKADYFDDLVDRNLLTNFRDTAKELRIRQSEFIQCLLEQGYIYRTKGRELRPYAHHVESGLFELKEWASGENAGVQTLITPKGRETFRLICTRRLRKSEGCASGG